MPDRPQFDEFLTQLQDIGPEGSAEQIARRLETVCERARKAGNAERCAQALTLEASLAVVA